MSTAGKIDRPLCDVSASKQASTRPYSLIETQLAPKFWFQVGFACQEALIEDSGQVQSAPLLAGTAAAAAEGAAGTIEAPCRPLDPDTAVGFAMDTAVALASVSTAGAAVAGESAIHAAAVEPPCFVAATAVESVVYAVVAAQSAAAPAFGAAAVAAAASPVVHLVEAAAAGSAAGAGAPVAPPADVAADLSVAVALPATVVDFVELPAVAPPYFSQAGRHEQGSSGSVTAAIKFALAFILDGAKSCSSPRNKSE